MLNKEEQYWKDFADRNGHVSKGWAMRHNRGLYTGPDNEPRMLRTTGELTKNQLPPSSKIDEETFNDLFDIEMARTQTQHCDGEKFYQRKASIQRRHDLEKEQRATWTDDEINRYNNMKSWQKDHTEYSVTHHIYPLQQAQVAGVKGHHNPSNIIAVTHKEHLEIHKTSFNTPEECIEALERVIPDWRERMKEQQTWKKT